MTEIAIQRKVKLANGHIRALMPLAITLTAVLAAVPAFAQVYKWVDEKGVTNYSNEAPADRKAVKKVDVVADKLSFYSPQESSTRAAAHSGVSPALADRIDRLERQLQAERQARQSAASAESQALAAAAYQQCLADRRVDCDGYAGYLPYGAPLVVVAPFRHRHPVPFPNVTVTGVTAGNVTVAIRAAGGRFNGTPGVTAASGPAPKAPTPRGFF